MAPREFYERIPSTQDRALSLARAGAAEGTRVVARQQTRGRGRLARRWESPSGGLYLSIVLRSPRAHPGLLPLSIGARLAAAFRSEYGLPVVVKWPNDLLVVETGRAARKLSGILTDEVASPTLGRAVVAGVGVNVRLDRSTVPPSLDERVVALDEFVTPPPPLEEVEAHVVAASLGAAEGLSSAEGVERARAFCREMLYGVGRPVTVDGRPVGRIETLGDEGELWIARTTDRVAIWAGDVRVDEAP